jgi:hypothetical protein
VIADLAELHQHIHDAEEVRVIQRLLRLVRVYVLVVEETLATGEIALNDMLYLLW